MNIELTPYVCVCCFATPVNPCWPVSLTWEAATSVSYDLHACSFLVSNSCLALRFVSCRCVFCFPCTLSLCLQEEGVVSFCKVCAIGLVNTPSHHLLNDTIKARPLPPCFPATPHAPMLLTLRPLTPPAACATEHTESELPITPLDRLLELTIPGTPGIVAQPTQSHLYF